MLNVRNPSPTSSATSSGSAAISPQTDSVAAARGARASAIIRSSRSTAGAAGS